MCQAFLNNLLKKLIFVKNSSPNNTKRKKISITTGKFANTLNKLLQHHSLSYRKFAKALGVTHPYLFRLAKGKHSNPGIDAVSKMAKFFKISIPQLLGEEDIDFKNRPKLIDLNFDEG